MKKGIDRYAEAYLCWGCGEDMKEKYVIYIREPKYGGKPSKDGSCERCGKKTRVFWFRYMMHGLELERLGISI